jgi:uncharacterized protein (TIGR00730 family)
MEKRICVFGSSSSAIDQHYLDETYRLGQFMAQEGWGLVFGAGDMGLMGAVARGVHSLGGSVVGVLPEFMNIPGIPYEKCDECIITPTMRERKAKMEDLADGFVVVPGGFGTLEELCEVLTLKQLKRHQKPIVLLNTGGFFDELLQMFQTIVDLQFAKEVALTVYSVARTPEEVIAQIKDYHYVDTGSKWFTPDSPR